MTREQFEKLKKYEQQIKLANSNYVRLSRSEREEIREVYVDMGNRMTPQQLNCNGCVLQMMKNIAAAYEKYEIYLKTFGSKKTEQSNHNSNLPQPDSVEEGK